MFVAIHTALVVLVGGYVGYQFRSSSEIAITWLVFIIVDFPIGYLAIWIVDTLPGFNSFINWVILPTVVIGLLGGVQWYFIGLWLGGRAKVPDSQCASCGYNLTGNVSGVCPECGKDN